MADNEFDFLKGMNDGEKELYRKCLEYESEHFKLIPNAMFNRHDKGTNQIDLIAISKKGIFVLEMKDFKGWIFGDENHVEWTQSLFSGNGKTKKYKFRNPIKQNDNHIKTIKNILSENNFNNLPIYNVIVFGHQAVLKEIYSTVDVVNISHIESVFKKYRDIAIEQEEIENIFRFMNKKNIVDSSLREEHIDYVTGLKTENKLDKKTNLRARKIINKRHTKNRKGNWYSVLDLIKRHKRISFVLIILLMAFILKDGWIFLLILLVGGLSIKFKDRRGIALAILLTFLFLSNNPLDHSSKLEDNTPTESSSEVTIDNSDSNGQAEQNKAEVDEKKEIEDSTKEIETIKSEDTNALVSAESKDTSDEISDGGEAIKKVTEADQELEITNEDESFQEEESNDLIDVETKDDNEVSSFKNEIYLGTEKAYVKEYFGEADRISENENNIVWHYKSSSINFDSQGRVTGWNNRYNQLDSGFLSPTENAKPISIGDSKANVLKALGSADTISATMPRRWNYESSYVTFDDQGNVNGWLNRYNQLDAGFLSAEEAAAPIGIGSSKENVLEALGSPNKINELLPRRWNYDSSYITFDDQGYVSGWINQYDQLDSGLLSPKKDAAAIGIGSSKEDVLEALGSADKINELLPSRWNYGSSYITFDEQEYVNGWINQYDQLDSAFISPKEDVAPIDIGSKKEMVLEAFGSPDKITSAIPNRWYYSLAYIEFDETNSVKNWQDYNNILSKKFVE